LISNDYSDADETEDDGD